MDISASQWSNSGCESGWTLYLDQSSYSKNLEFDVNGNFKQEEEEEDLSMVSDASSGPPHYSEFYDEAYSINRNYFPNNNKKKNNSKKTNEFGNHYDDTASSHVFTKKKVGGNIEASRENVVEFSQGFSATHFKGKSSFKKHFGLFKSSTAEKSACKETGGFQGRKWK